VPDKLGLIVQEGSQGLLYLSIPLSHLFSSHCLPTFLSGSPVHRLSLKAAPILR
jgi:hypothetical protein